MTGPLSGIRIVEFTGLGPTPFAAMLLADFGAEVIRIDRPGAPQLIPQTRDLLNRGRNWVELDLKLPTERDAALDLVAGADGLIEGMRPGVMERLGLGPEAALARNPALVYGRMTGWGQSGPLADRAGHDINYIALTGLLHASGGDSPEFPLNLLGDFGGGGMYLAFGMLAALIHSARTGQGQVVDAAITDGVAHLGTMIASLHAAGVWTDRRRSNLLDGAAPFYRVYQCACGGHVAVGAIEPQFWAALLEGLALTNMPDQMDRRAWPAMCARIAARFAENPRDSWVETFEGTDACVAPVLSLSEAPSHPHMAARGIFGPNGPEAAPRLSATPARAGADGQRRPIAEVLAAWTPRR